MTRRSLGTWSKPLHCGPTRTTKELSEEFGVDYSWLGRLIASDPNAPKPIAKCGINCERVTRYSLAAARRWWSARKQMV